MNNIKEELTEFFRFLTEKSLYSLSGEDMMRLVNNKAKLLVYDELVNYKNINDLLEPYGAVIILYVYEINNNSEIGHWTCLFMNPSTKIVEFFDSYGYKPDEERKFIPKNIWKNFYLSNILNTISKNKEVLIEYNQYDYQGRSYKDVATCGRWVGMRILLKHLTNKEFAKLFYSPNKIENNLLISFITYKIINK